MNKFIKYILIVVIVIIGIIILDSIQALVFNNNPIIGVETKCMKKVGILVNTYHCGNGKNITKIRLLNRTCDSDIICGNNIDDDSVTLSIKDDTLTNKGATFILKNNTNKEYWYGEEYIIEKKDNNSWKEVSTLTGEPLTWNMIAYTLKPNEEKEINIDWSFGYGELESGDYRLVKSTFREEDRPIDETKILYLYVEFSIK